ncbi:MAG: Bax inhibitor-1/YccA family protein [Flavobacteriaceae bacterium]|nr:Bax inhibitor-1/YccA family protein [Flavobacteriaceae bacterium]
MASYNYKTTNPAFSRGVWRGYSSTSNKMTVNGILLKALFCIILVALSTFLTWSAIDQGFNIHLLMYSGLIATLIFSLLTVLFHKLAPVFVPLYALALGFFLGSITVFAKSKFNEIPTQTIEITISTFLLMLFLYKARLVQVSQRIKSALVVAVAIIITIYATSWTLQFINIETPFIILDNTSYLSIAFNIIAAGVVVFTLLLDFDFIERKKNHAPKYMEWVATWGLLITIVWVYIEAIILIKRMVLNK